MDDSNSLPSEKDNYGGLAKSEDSYTGLRELPKVDIRKIVGQRSG
jgi:hypothetical protein